MLGQEVPPGLIADWDIDVMADGSGLPPGRGGVAEGRVLYRQHCAVCHGPDGQGGSADRLAGADPGLTGEWPEKTVGNYWPYASTLFDFIRRAMPMTAPGSLDADETYALVAYLLYLNDIVAADAIMDQQTLPAVQMPNRGGFLPIMQ